MNIQQALQQGKLKLAETSPTAMLDTQVLLAYVLQCSNVYLFTWPEKELSKLQQLHFEELLQQRHQGLPVAYLTGVREFWSMDFAVNDCTLIPRPETETLVEYILLNFSNEKELKLLDLGTGTGAIAIAIASERPEWDIFAGDISGAALALARQNRDTHHTKNVSFIKSNWFDNVQQHDFDIIVSNPPYIADTDPHLHQGDVRFEPQAALSSGKTGMDDIEHICRHAGKFLNNKGYLILEHGYNQKEPVARCFTDNGFIEIDQVQDISGQPRMTKGRKA